jgi:hypothetical protein
LFFFLPTLDCVLPPFFSSVRYSIASTRFFCIRIMNEALRLIPSVPEQKQIINMNIKPNY